ncbi:MAG: hypothetical protein QW728_07675 [Thermoplasmata archaeon]
MSQNEEIFNMYCRKCKKNRLMRLYEPERYKCMDCDTTIVMNVCNTCRKEIYLEENDNKLHCPACGAYQPIEILLHLPAPVSIPLEEFRVLENTPLWIYHEIAGADTQFDPQETELLMTILNRLVHEGSPLTKIIFKSALRNLTDVIIRYSSGDTNAIDGIKKSVIILKKRFEPTVVDAFRRDLLITGRVVAEHQGMSQEEKQKLLQIIELFKL